MIVTLDLDKLLKKQNISLNQDDIKTIEACIEYNIINHVERTLKETIDEALGDTYNNMKGAV